MNLVDVHCHLNHEKFKGDLDGVMERARKAGVRAIVCSGVNHAANLEVLELVERYPDILKCSLGLYPVDILGLGPDEIGLPRQTEPINLEEEFKFIEGNKDKIVAVGECGLEFQWDTKHWEEQKRNFAKIIEFAEKIKKPIVVHSRKGEGVALEMLESSRLKKVLLHCFNGNKKLVKKGADLGYYFSIPPIIVKLQHFQMMAEIVPLGQLLTETDAPWLSPYRKRNEPAFVGETIKKMGEILKRKEEEIAEEIWGNYGDLFG